MGLTALAHSVLNARAGAFTHAKARMVDWNPLLAAFGVEPGKWHLTSEPGPCAVVMLIDVGGELG